MNLLINSKSVTKKQNERKGFRCLEKSTNHHNFQQGFFFKAWILFKFCEELVTEKKKKKKKCLLIFHLITCFLIFFFNIFVLLCVKSSIMIKSKHIIQIYIFIINYEYTAQHNKKKLSINLQFSDDDKTSDPRASRYYAIIEYT